MASKSRKRPATDSIDQVGGDDGIESDQAEFGLGAVFGQGAVEFEFDGHPEESCHRTDDWNELADDMVPGEDSVQSPESVTDAHRPSLASVVESSSELLNRLILQFNDLTELVSNVSATGPDHSDQSEVETLRRRVAELEDQVADLQQQNNDLASQVARPAQDNPVSAAAAGSKESLSWEARKELILQQMEDETFDAEAFIETLNPETTDACDPVAHVQQLHEELEYLEAELQELQYLRTQSQPPHAAKPRAADDANTVDGDALIRQERAKLQELQAECEARIRESEIAVSLERAKLSRERRELAHKNAELEEQLSHLRREAEVSSKAGATGSRRWLAKLGLQDSDKET